MKTKRITVWSAMIWWLLGSSLAATENDLVLPALSDGVPAAGKKVAMTAGKYDGTKVHHLIYLPPDWQDDWQAEGKSWPVVVEYTGNYFPAAGSTGEVEGAGLGFGLSGGRAIWIVLPYVSVDRQTNQRTWWGDEQATLDYAKTNVPKICQQFGGDAKRVVLCGFSRGAIGVNYLGLHDDEIAKLWCGFVSHDHFDGVRQWGGTEWGAPLAKYRAEAKQRLDRLNGRPVLVCQQPSTKDIQTYLSAVTSLSSFTFLDVNMAKIFPKIPNDLVVHGHNDRWMLKDSPERRKAWLWMNETVGQ
jgi:hypothetical protein